MKRNSLGTIRLIFGWLISLCGFAMFFLSCLYIAYPSFYKESCPSGKINSTIWPLIMGFILCAIGLLWQIFFANDKDAMDITTNELNERIDDKAKERLNKFLSQLKEQEEKE